jgi:hypothetical protein
VWSTIVDVFAPFNPLAWITAERLTQLGLLLVLGAALAVVSAASARLNETRWRAIGLIALGLAWSTPVLLLLGLSRIPGSWYAVFPLAGLATSLAGLLHLALDLVRGPSSAAQRAIGVVATGALAWTAFVPLQTSPLWTRYDEWLRASAALRQTLTAVDAQVPTARPGSRTTILVTPRITSVQGPRPALRWVTTIMDDGLNAYLEMRFPGRKVRSVPANRQEPPKPDEVLLVLVTTIVRTTVDDLPEIMKTLPPGATQPATGPRPREWRRGESQPAHKP